MIYVNFTTNKFFSMEKATLNRFFLNQSDSFERLHVIDWMLNPVNDITLKDWMRENWDLLSEYDTSVEPDIEKIWFKLQESIKKEIAANTYSNQLNEIHHKPSSIRRILLYASVAAAVFAIVVGGYLFFKESYTNNHDDNLIAYGKNVIVEKNNTQVNKLIKLEDGTTVSLNPNSIFYYPTHFINGKREVALKGNAFFQVAKNPEKPFFVYANNIVTKVLGTSFTILTNPNTKEVSVSVHTGRVQVFEKNSASQSTFNEKVLTSNGVIVTANQEAIYSNKKNDFQTTLIPVPLPLYNVKEKDKSFDFERANLPHVISKIQEVYGVEVVLENDNFNRCIFSGELNNENLFEKLDIICTAINATYEVSGTKVLIKGNGCD